MEFWDEWIRDKSFESEDWLEISKQFSFKSSFSWFADSPLEDESESRHESEDKSDGFIEKSDKEVDESSKNSEESDPTSSSEAETNPMLIIKTKINEIKNNIFLWFKKPPINNFNQLIMK